jgi:hypothetical protein
MKFARFTSRVAITAALGVAAANTGAAPVTIDFSGALTSTFGSLVSGDAYTASYTYDPSIAPRAGSDSSFAFFDNLLSVTFTDTTASYTATIGPGTGLSELQQDNDNPMGNDRYALVGRNPAGLPINGLPITEIGFALNDSTKAAITDASVLLNPPSLSSFGDRTLLLFFDKPGAPDSLSSPAR